jgi:SPX domain protein involved in polyphosphate accumulation
MVRYERKYLVPNENLDKLRERIKPFVSPDFYARENNASLPQYTVRSIYYDTVDMECHEEKREGVELRKKFRVRSYNDYEKNKKSVLEIKKKLGNRIDKHRAFVGFDNVETLFETGDLYKYVEPPDDDISIDDARRFIYHLKKRNLKPTVLVIYEREAYHGNFDPGVRITFDKNIRSSIYPVLSDLFNNNNLRFLFARHFILEIKYFTEKMPTWAQSVVQEFQLRHEALSKYAIGYDVNKVNPSINRYY